MRAQYGFPVDSIGGLIHPVGGNKYRIGLLLHPISGTEEHISLLVPPTQARSGPGKDFEVCGLRAFLNCRANEIPHLFVNGG